MEALRERFGKYHVLEKIAQGGMAEVYKVKTVGIAGFEKIQALKRILPASAREGRFIRSFIDEARIAVELTHRNIVQVFDFGKADGELFMAMELIEGKDLRTAISEGVQKDAFMPLPVCAYIISEVAGGLDYAHHKSDAYGVAMNIVHCDVSPSNVMLSVDGYVKILDFGIARATFASALERRRLRGKPRYMAPEQTYGDPPTYAADVFALGIIAWELFTGLPLYKGPNLKAILEMVRTTVPPRIDTLNAEVPLEIVEAVATALSREPEKRGTAGDLAAACARTALAGGSHKLASWLAEIAELDSVSKTPWTAENTSISVPDKGRESVHEIAQPPTRPSLTQSLAEAIAQAPHMEFEGNFEGPEAASATVTAARTIASEFAKAAAEVSRPSAPALFGDATQTAQQRFGDRDPTAITSAWAQAASQPEASIDIAFAQREATVPNEPFARPSVQALQFSIPTTFDEAESTSHGMQLPVDGLAYEPDDTAPPFDLLADEPIDDNLVATSELPIAERRRAVIVAGLLAGAPIDVLRPIAKALGELAYQRGGVVTSLADESLVVAFGLEVAGEDDVAIAMSWALDASTYVRDTQNAQQRHSGAIDPKTTSESAHSIGSNRTSGRIGSKAMATAAPRDSSTDISAPPAITLRIGARTGVVTTADRDGARIPSDAADEARALARDAAAERPLFAGAAGRLTTHLFELREVMASSASTRRVRRGRVIEVIGPRSVEDRANEREQLTRRGAFVGRLAQLAALDSWFERAIAADRRLTVLLVGPAGSGKTRLVAEMIARRAAAGKAQRVVMTATSPAHRVAPFSMVIELLQASLVLPFARGRAARQQVAQRLGHLLADKVPVERVRAITLDVDRAMELRDGVGVGAPEVADLRPRLAAGIEAFRGAFADRDHPLLTVLEDIHQTDAASLEVLRHTMAVPARGPELLVVTTRPDGPPLPAVDIVIHVADLDGAELRALVIDRLGVAATPENIATVLARGGGNPLFVEELAQGVREAGEELPASARDVVAARIDRLSPRAKSALRYAAILGGSARARLVEELVDDAAAPPIDSADAAGPDSVAEIDELIAADLVTRTGNGDIEFSRGLVREVVYDALSARTQRDSHGRVGRLLASRFFAGREEPPAEIAEHLERGGELAGAAAFWLRAGRLAFTASDGPTAIAYFSRTLALDRELGVIPPTPTSRTRRREALAGREEARRHVGDLVSDPGDLDELEQLCAGDEGRLADVAIRRAHRLLRYADFTAAMAATLTAEDRALAARDTRQRGDALSIRAEILERLGRLDEALTVVAGARELFHRCGAVHEEMAAMIVRGRIHLMRAQYEAARDVYRPVMALIETTGDPWLERISTAHVAVIEMCLGNFAVAMTSAQRSLELCTRYGDRSREGDALSVAAIILLEVGLYDQAAVKFEEALDILARTGSRWSRADCLIHAGICDLRRGRSEGLGKIVEAVSEARRLGARYLEANGLVARAAAHLRRGDLAAAIEDAAAGTAVAAEFTLIGYEIQGLARHGVALARARRVPEAMQVVRRALALLEHQRYMEGSEEEVLASCAEVLEASGDRARALVIRERGRASAQRKYDALIDPTWRKAYASIPEIAALLAT